MSHVFFGGCRARGDLCKSSCDLQQVHHPVAHLASKQLIGFLSLLTLSDVKEDAEHGSISYISIVSLASGGYPTHVGARQNAKINFVGTNHSACSGEGRPHSL